MADLLSSAPAAFTALLGLIQTAAAGLSTPPQVFAFDLAEYEPGLYVMLTGISDHKFEAEYLGSFTQQETYTLPGKVSYFTGANVLNDSSIAVDALNATYTAFLGAVMTPVMSNRGQGGIPILGVTSSPSPNQLFPDYARYDARPGYIGGRQAGWVGEITWAFTLKALCTPA